MKRHGGRSSKIYPIRRMRIAMNAMATWADPNTPAGADYKHLIEMVVVAQRAHGEGLGDPEQLRLYLGQVKVSYTTEMMWKF